MCMCVRVCVCVCVRVCVLDLQVFAVGDGSEYVRLCIKYLYSMHMCV